jgi:hypothetical protein
VEQKAAVIKQLPSRVQSLIVGNISNMNISSQEREEELKMARTIRKTFGAIKNCAFFLYKGMPYFTYPHGDWNLWHPIVDGIIQRQSDESELFPTTDVKMIHPADMGEFGMEFKEGDNPMDARFWSENPET